MKPVLLVLVFMVPLLVVSSFSYAETDAKVDKQKADFAATKAKAEAGDPDAQFNLGGIYLDGYVVPRDVKQALYWFNKAAQGDPVRQYMIGEMYYKGEGVPKALDKALEWFRKAADQGHFNAQAMLRLLE